MFQIKWVWQNLKGYRKRYIFALISTVFLSATMMVNSIIISQIMDTIFAPIQMGASVTPALINTLVKLLVMLITWSIIRTSYEYLTIMTYEKCSQGLIYKLRGDLYKNMQRQDMSFYSENRTGDLMTRLTGDMDMIRHTVAWISRMTIDCIILFLSTTIIFFVKDALFATCMLLVTPIIFIITMIFSKKVGPLYVDLREKLSRLNTCAQENIAGNRVVKAFAREKYEAYKFEEKNKEFKESNLKASLLWLKYAPYVDAISQSLSIAVLLVGGLFLINGRITIGTFTLFNSLCWTLANPMRSIGMLLNDLQRFFASSSKIIELYNSTPDIKNSKKGQQERDKSIRTKGKIEFSNVCLKLHDTTVLEDINLTINEGETVAIMGSTGCGKTSLINLIPRFNDVSSGKIILDDKEIKDWNLRDLRHSIGMATQEVFLFSDTVDSNIAYGNSKMSEEEVAKYAKIADVDFITNLSDGFETIIGERGTGLSGGQKQRIALARALSIKPSILILDDTTSAVDLETEKYIQDGLKTLDFSCTKIIVAQRISTTKSADKIIIMDKGKIIQQGTHDELIKADGYYREVYLLQNGINESEVAS